VLEHSGKAKLEHAATRYASTMHLLLVEDDLDLGASLVQVLTGAHISCEWVRSAADARATERR
jgi:DNA-binding NtrC family response regulator